MNITAENYFSPEADKFYMGSTQYKRFSKCESAALAILNGEWREETTTAMLVGSYVDSHFEGTLDLFRAQHPDIFKRDGSLKADYEQTEYIIQRIERDEAFMHAMSGQKQVIMTGDIEGVPVKIKIDSLLPDMTVDLKVMRDMDDIYVKDDGWQPFWKAWGYDIQAAMYQAIRSQNDFGTVKPFGLAVATKEKPEPNLGLYLFSQSTLDAAYDEVCANIRHYQNLKDGVYPPTRCEHCDYCYSTKKLQGWVEL